MYTNQNRDDIINYIRTRLGYPVVTLEISLVNPTPITEIVFTGNGVTREISFNTSDYPIKSGSVGILAILNNGGVDVEARLTDNNGSFLGTGGGGTVNYLTGRISVIFDYPVKAGTQVYVSYVLDKSDWIYLQAIRTALQWYSARRGIRKWKLLNIVAGQDEYEIDTQPVMRITSFRMNESTPVLINEYFGIPFLIFSPDQISLNPSAWVDYYSYLHYVKRIKKYFSVYYEYVFVPDKYLKLIPAPQRDGQGLVDYRVAVQENDLSILRPVEYLIVRDYAYAYVLESLGRIRGKYTSYPVVGGETSFGGAEELLEEAKTLYENLEKRISDLAEPLPVVVK